MVYPTQMTITTGTTVFAGDPDSDERINSREVRLSVTFEIDEAADIDLTDLARMKAAEVERARVAVQEGITALDRRAALEQMEPYPNEPPAPPFDPSDPTLEPPEEDGDAPDPFPEEADYLTNSHLSARWGPAPNASSTPNTIPKPNTFPAPDAVRAGNGRYIGNGADTPPQVPAPPPLSTRFPAAPARAEQVPKTETGAETDWATKPQVLAIGSHFRRLGLSPENQTALLRARFGKFRPERLTKDEAAGLMRSLERGEIESEQSYKEPLAAHAG